MKTLSNLELQRTKERESFFYNFSYVGIGASGIFSIVNILNGKPIVGLIEVFCCFAAIYNIYLYKKKKNYNFSSSIILIIMFVMLSVLVTSGGVERTGVLWIYTFPILSFFLKGKKEGIFWIVGLWAILLSLILISIKIDSFTIEYSLLEMRQTFASFVAVSVMVYFYENTVSNYKKRIEDKNRELSSLNDSLEERVEEEIQKRDASEKLFKSIFNNSSVGIGIFNTDGDIQDLNPTAENILNCKEYQCAVFKDLEEFNSVFQLLAKGETTTYTFPKITIDCNQKATPIEMNLFSIKDNSARVANIILFFNDISQRIEQENKEKQQENLIVQQSRMVSLGELLGDISHHWRQPLNTLGLSLQTIEMNLEDEKPNKQHVQKILGNSMDIIDSMSHTIDNFIDYFKPENEKTEFDMLKTINSSLEVLSGTLNDNNIHLSKDFAQEEILYYGYNNGLKEAILNILKNAVEAVTKNREDSREITIYATKDEKNISIKIEDNGGGVDEEIINKVFDPYFTTKHKARNTGISLYMTKMVIEKNMNGSLEIKNGKNGAVVTAVFPFEQRS